MFNRTWRDDELNLLEACNLPDTPGMDLWRLAQQGLRAPARSAAGPESACAPAAGNPSAEGAASPCSRTAPALPQLGLSHSVGPWILARKWPLSPCSRTFVSACAAAAGSEPFGGSVDPSAEVAPSFFHVKCRASLLC